MSVSAYLVTRNHADCLDRALHSIKGWVDEILIVDTGSTDRTLDVARSYGAAIVPIDWADDFSTACNTALERATRDWVLSINPDEELVAPGARLIPVAVANSKAFAYSLRIRQLLSPDQAGSGTVEWHPRLFRRDPELRYIGRLHPTFRTPLAELADRRGQSISALDVEIRRHAYLSQQTPDKVRWIVRLLEAELADRPGQLRFMIELGRNLLLLNDPRGHEVLAEASEQVLGLAGQPTAPHPDVGLLLEYLLTVAPEQSRSRLSRDEARELALRWFPRTPPVLWAVAAERFAAGDYRAAAGPLGQLVHLGTTQSYDVTGGFDPAIIGADARLNLGLCHLHLGDWAAAKLCFATLVGDASHGDRARRLYAQAEARQQPAPASGAAQ